MSEKTLKIRLWGDSGNESEDHELPAKYAVCSRCEGHGSILNPSIGSYAYTPQEFDEAFPEEEQRSAYFCRGGMYDVQCSDCKGARVVLKIDVAACKKAGFGSILKQFRAQEQERSRSEAEDRATMRGESGWRDD